MILMIDNYDSFTYNVVQLLYECGREVSVARNDEINIAEIEKMAPDTIIISPGPSRPENAGISLEVVRHFSGKIPILGICLGHQTIGQAFGANIIKAGQLYHGKTSRVRHKGRGVFRNLPSPITCTRYHSLVVQEKSLSKDFMVTAYSEDGEIMGIRHKHYDLEGIQFHPESIASKMGREMMINFLQGDKKMQNTGSLLKKVMKKEKLSRMESESLMMEITEGRANQLQTAALLTALNLRGESIEEITGFASVMREKALSIKKPQGVKLIDTCGTGGDGLGTINISTISAFVAAGAGISVAKHGNRSVTSKCGSADLLEELGIKLDLSPEEVSQCLEKTGIAFLYARSLHPAMKNVAPIRKELGIRTVFNILGPLSNPAGADHQLIGVFAPELTEKLARVLIELGLKSGMVVHGEDGLDEITLCGKSRISFFKNGFIKTFDLDPAELGLSLCKAEDIKGGETTQNAEIARNILSGRETGPKKDIILLNSAAAIISGGLCSSFKGALDIARESLESGKAEAKLKELIEFTQKAGK